MEGIGKRLEELERTMLLQNNIEIRLGRRLLPEEVMNLIKLLEMIPTISSRSLVCVYAFLYLVDLGYSDKLRVTEQQFKIAHLNGMRKYRQSLIL